MKRMITPSRFTPTMLALITCSAALASACVEEDPGLEGTAGAGATATMGGSQSTSAGTATTSGTAGSPRGGEASSMAGSGGEEAGAPGGGTGGATPGGGTGNGGTSGGTTSLPEAGAGGAASGGAGEGGAGGVPEEPAACIFHTDVVSEPDGAGGAAPVPSITVQTSPFVGQYLADGAGRTLFVYGNDLPGDCRVDNTPKSRCEADCLVSWPVFDAGPRVLGPGLDDAAFGSIQRGDGSFQTTYHGWPLYYYKNDLTTGQMSGQGKGKTWHVAEVTPASIVIMKEGSVKYLADGAGYTLYVSAADTVGKGNQDPVSACSGDCLTKFERFHQKNPSLVPSLEQQDFSVFIAGEGELQLAFKGQPLYLAKTDDRAGNTTGVATPGFTVAIP